MEEEVEQEQEEVFEDQDTQAMFGGSVAVVVDTSIGNEEDEEEEGDKDRDELHDYIEKQKVTNDRRGGTCILYIHTYIHVCVCACVYVYYKMDKWNWGYHINIDSVGCVFCRSDIDVSLTNPVLSVCTTSTNTNTINKHAL